jgi:flagellar motility protein MotE (MotC chaperone)
MARRLARWALWALPLAALAAEPPASQSAAAHAAGEALPPDALELEVRQAALRTLAQDTEARLAELARLREELAALLQPAEQDAAADLGTLIQFYQSMKPKNAAALLEKLPADLAAEVLGSMRARQAGRILDAMAPANAVRISQRMAGGRR